MKQSLKLQVNGQTRELLVEPRQTLLQVLREDLQLTGTKEVCLLGSCGACTVLVDGKPVLSCLTLAAACRNKSVTTIEGVMDGGELHPLQQAFIDKGAVQCGYCTPGMIMAAVDIVNRRGHALDEKTIREDLDGNICRCTGYHNIVKAVAAGAEAMAGGSTKDREPPRQAAE